MHKRENERPKHWYTYVNVQKQKGNQKRRNETRSGNTFECDESYIHSLYFVLARGARK